MLGSSVLRVSGEIMAAVIQPLLKPREIPDLDAFTTFWAAYTGARTAKWQQRVNLALQQMDDSRIGDLIDDLRRRRDNLEAEQYRIQRGQISSVEDYESDVRRESRRSSGGGSGRAGVNSYVSQVGAFARHNARESARYDGAVADEAARLDEEEREQAAETEEFLDLMSRSVYAGDAAAQARTNPSPAGERQAYIGRLSGMMRNEGGTSPSPARKRAQDAHALALYYAAVENGHHDGARAIAAQYPGFRTGGGPRGVLNVSTRQIYQKAREQHAIDHPEDFTEGTSSATRGTEGGAIPVPTPDSAFSLYGAQSVAIGGQITTLDAQIAALTVADQARRDQGMGAIQAMLNQNFNFAPPAIQRDDEAQEFIELMEDTGDPERFAAFQEGVEEFGGRAGFRRAQLSGEASPYDPIRSTSVDEFSSGDQGSFIFGHLYEEVDGVEQLLRGDPTKIAEAFGQMMRVGGNTARINALGRDAEHFQARFTDINAALSPFSPIRPGASVTQQTASGTALGRMYMAMGYVQAETDDAVYRQYGDGTIKISQASVGTDPSTAEPEGFIDVDPSAVPSGLFGPVPSDPNTARFDGFDQNRDDLPVTMDEVFSELSETKNLARGQMGDGDVLFGQLMSASLNSAMAEQPENRLQAIYANATILNQLPRDLAGDRGLVLARTMERRSAEGNLDGLFSDVDRIIDSGQDRSVIDRRFADYMQEYGTIARVQTSERRVDDAGNVYDVRTPFEVRPKDDEPLTSVDETTGQIVSAQFEAPIDVGRGVIQPGPDVIGLDGPPTDATRPGPVGTTIPLRSYQGGPYERGKRSDPAELIAVFEAQEGRARALERIRQRAVDPGTTGYTDPLLQQSLRQPTVYELNADQQEEHERLSEEYDSINDRMRTSPGVSRAEAMFYGGITKADLDRRSEILDRLTDLEAMRFKPQEPMGSVLSADERRTVEDQGAISRLQNNKRVGARMLENPILGRLRDQDPVLFRELEGAIARMQDIDSPVQEQKTSRDRAAEILMEQLDKSVARRQGFETELDSVVEVEKSREDQLERQVEIFMDRIRASAQEDGVDIFTSYNPMGDPSEERLRDLARNRILLVAQQRGHDVSSFDDLTSIIERDRIPLQTSIREEADLEQALLESISEIDDYQITTDE